jgi:phage repressor protein C with HTH and peptisase S24 domain
MNDQSGLLSWRTIAEKLSAQSRGARSKLADALGMDRGQLTRKLRSDTFPRADQHAVILAFLDGKSTLAEAQAMVDDTPQRVTLYSRAAPDGEGRVMMGEPYATDSIELPQGMRLAGAVFAIQAPDAAMEPRIFEGERRAVMRDVTPRPGQDCVVEFADGSAVLRNYTGAGGHMIKVRQFNPPLDVVITRDLIRGLHVVWTLA